MELTASELWSRILEVVRPGLPDQAFRTWLAGTVPSALSERELLVEAPSLFHVEWLEDKYGPVLHDAALKVLNKPLTISFTASDTPGSSTFPTISCCRDSWTCTCTCRVKWGPIATATR